MKRGFVTVLVLGAVNEEELLVAATVGSSLVESFLLCRQPGTIGST